jgi:glyoxylase-like metal-dependent hydrolase (beta-lactamase superfamily II)
MIKRLNLGMVNAYLIEGDKGTILVDTGFINNRDKLVSMLKNIDLKLIILTHGHGDHIANARYISEKFDVPIAMHEDDFALARDNSINQLYADTFFGYLLRKVSKMGPQDKIEVFTPEIFLENGMDLSDYGVSAKVIHVKGHTEGSIALLVGKDEIIVGDTFMNYFKPTKARIYEDKQELMKSLKLIEETGAKKIYPGHGQPIDAKKFFDLHK